MIGDTRPCKHVYIYVYSGWDVCLRSLALDHLHGSINSTHASGHEMVGP